MPSKNEGGNNVPLVTSMDSLDHSIRDIVSATIVGDGKRTLAALDPVYGTMDLVYAAIKSGTATLKKNPERQSGISRASRGVSSPSAETAGCCKE